MANYNQVIFVWKDSNGLEAMAYMPTIDQDPGGASDYAALADAFEACSNGKIIAILYQQALIRTGTPVNAVYNTVFDKAVLYDTNPTSQRFQRQSIIAPKQDIFLPGNVKVNLADARITVLGGIAVTKLGDSVGNPIGPFLRGARFMKS